mgnify:CR=1 FL=1
MFGITDLYLFIIAGILLNITPGADMLYILSNGFQKGFKAGIIAMLGIGTGCLFHVFLAVVGLSAILKTSVVAFTIVKFMGVIYLMYLGFSLLFKSKAKSKEESVTLNNQTLKKVFSNGVLINSLNPKVAIFFITFLPQFIDVNASQQELGLLVLGLVFIVFATFVNIIILYVSLQISGKFKYTQIFTSVIKKVVGSLFILFGIKLATQDLI